MYNIERFEGEWAVLECDGQLMNIPRDQLPENAREGDILQKTENGWLVDEQAAQERRSMLAARRRRMLRGGKA